MVVSAHNKSLNYYYYYYRRHLGNEKFNQIKTTFISHNLHNLCMNKNITQKCSFITEKLKQNINTMQYRYTYIYSSKNKVMSECAI